MTRTRVAIGGVLVLLWAAAAVFGYVRYGLFVFPGPGNDFTFHWIQSSALDAGDTAFLYSEGGRERYVEALNAHILHPATESVPTQALPYPPLWPWLFTPFTLPSPPTGFALWVALNLAAALWLAYRAASFFPTRDRLWTAVLVFTAFPVAFSIYLGQAQVLFAVALTECYLALRAGKDLRAGLWLSLLLVKPQYAILLGPLLLWKRRWAAVGGAAAGVAAILVGSLLVAESSTLLDWPDSFSAYSGFREDAPQYMVNWRSLVLRVFPAISAEAGGVLVLLLGGATVACTALAWRGRWEPRAPDFPAKMTLLLLATLLANYHSHGYGAAILAVPIASLFAAGSPGQPTRLAIAAGLILPNLALTLQSVTSRKGIVLASILLALSILACFLSLLRELWREREAARLDRVDPRAQVGPEPAIEP